MKTNSSSNHYSKKFVRILSIVMIAAMLFSLTACRQSPVLEQIIYTQEATPDMDNTKKDNDKDNKNEDPLLSSRKESDVDKKSDYNRNQPNKGDTDSDKTASNLVYDAMGENNGTAENSGSGSNSSQTNTDTDNTGEEEIDSIKPSNDKTKTRTVVDATGAQVEVPENVELVTATGDAAIYIEMLGGKGRLLATSESVKENSIALQVFSELSGIPSLWEKDGTTAMSNDSFNRLLQLKKDHDEKPIVCFVISGQTTFSDEQLSQFADADLYLVTLPRFTMTENIKTAVNIMSNVLGTKMTPDGSTVSSSSVAQKYISWMDNTLSEVKGKHGVFSGASQLELDYDRTSAANGWGRAKYNYDNATDGLYTLFIPYWADVEYTVSAAGVYEAGMSGSGLANLVPGYSHSPLSYFMSVGGVANASALNLSTYNKTNVYVTPLVPATRNVVVASTGQIISKDSDGLNNSFTFAGGNYLGDAKFNKIIVNSQSMVGKIQASPLWKNYGFKDLGGTKGYGALDSNGNLMLSNIHGDYQILVNPCGVGSWVTGSPEAPLESVWINSVFYGDISDAALKQKISEFYSEFYSFTPDSALLNKIIAGLAE